MATLIRWILPVLLLAGIDWYAFQTLHTAVSSAWVHQLYWAIAVAVYLSAIAVIVFGFRFKSNTARMYATAVFFIQFVFKLLLSLAALADDVMRLLRTLAMALSSGLNGNVELVERSVFFCTIGLILASIPMFAMIYGMLRNPYRYKVETVHLPIENLPDELVGFTIVQISDIHTGSFTQTKPLHHAVELINQQQPDVVFFTGDLVNNHASEAKPYLPIFAKITARHGVFSVLGNHDYGDYVQWRNQQDYRQNFENMLQNHRQMGWKLLLNQHAVIGHNQHVIGIIGVENWSASPRFKKYGNLQTACQNLPQTTLNLLLSHDPSHWKAEVTKEFTHINATFSGHTHAFQFGINLPFFKWSPVRFMYKEWVGLYRQGKQYLYVNPGFGFVAYPGRVGFLPEITVFKLDKTR